MEDTKYTESWRFHSQFDNHKKLVQELYSILDQAAVEYDDSEDVVDDFTVYLKEWARQREEG